MIWNSSHSIASGLCIVTRLRGNFNFSSECKALINSVLFFEKCHLLTNSSAVFEHEVGLPVCDVTEALSYRWLVLDHHR